MAQEERKIALTIEGKKAELKAGVVAPGGVEGMVAEGRIPFFGKLLQGNDKITVCHVPPKGTQLGDTVERLLGGIYRFTSPEGIVRGFADEFDLTPQEEASLKTRIQAVS